MLKCLNLLFDKNNIFNNSANYMLIILFFTGIVAAFVFCCHNNLKIKKDIKQIFIETKSDDNKIKRKTIHNEIKEESKIQNKKLTKRNKKGEDKNKNKKKIKLNEPPKSKLNSKKRKIFFDNDANDNIKNILETGNFINNNHKNKEPNNKNKDKKNTLFFNINNNNIERKKKSLKKKNKFNKESSKNVLKRKTQNFSNLNDKIQENVNIYTDSELNAMDYEEAIKYDQRDFGQYYLSLIKNQHLLIFTFFQYKDYNAQMIKFDLFLFSFSINYVISAMFYSDDTLHQIYVDEGKFDILYQLPQMIYSSLISFFLEFILGNFGLFEENILDTRKRKKNKEALLKILKDISRVIRKKIILFFIITYLLTFAFWIYLGCFCAVYKNTQIHLLKEVLSSFAISFVSPFFSYLIPSILRIIALQNKKNDRSYLYIISKFLQSF